MKHLKDVNMTYFQHLRFSLTLSFVLLVHGLVPSLFTTYASDKLKSRVDSK